MGEIPNVDPSARVFEAATTDTINALAAGLGQVVTHYEDPPGTFHRLHDGLRGHRATVDGVDVKLYTGSFSSVPVDAEGWAGAITAYGVDHTGKSDGFPYAKYVFYYALDGLTVRRESPLETENLFHEYINLGAELATEMVGAWEQNVHVGDSWHDFDVVDESTAQSLLAAVEQWATHPERKNRDNRITNLCARLRGFLGNIF